MISIWFHGSPLICKYTEYWNIQIIQNDNEARGQLLSSGAGTGRRWAEGSLRVSLKIWVLVNFNNVPAGAQDVQCFKQNCVYMHNYSLGDSRPDAEVTGMAGQSSEREQWQLDRLGRGCKWATSAPWVQSGRFSLAVSPLSTSTS